MASKELAVVRSRKAGLGFLANVREAWRNAKSAEKGVLIFGLVHVLPFDDALLAALFPPTVAVMPADELIALPVYLGTMLIVAGRYITLPKELGTSRTGR